MRVGRGVATSLVVVGATVAGLHAQPAFMPAPAAPSDPLAALTSDQMRTRATEMVARMQQQLQQGVHVQAIAKSQKDTLKLTCVNHHLLEQKQLLNISESNVASLNQATRAGNHSAQAAHYKQVAQAAAQCDETMKALGECAGANEITLTANRPVTVTIDKATFVDNPTDDCNKLGLSNCVEQPIEYIAWASPFTPD